MSADRTAQAGTVESMDCLVTVTGAGGSRSIEIAGASAARFKTDMEKTINTVLDRLQKPDASAVRVSVQDNGAMDLVLAARVEAAYLRFAGGGA